MSKQAIQKNEKRDKADRGAWGDWAMFGWVSEVATTIGANRMGDVLGGAITGAARTKASVDRNIASLLSMANLPSKRDYERLQTKIDSLQGTLINLTRKLDRLASELGHANGSAATLNGRGTHAATSRPSKTHAGKRTRSRKPS